MELLTRRLRIREFGPNDASSLIEGINDIEVSKWLLTVPHPYTAKDADWWINHTQEEAKKSPREEYDFAIELLSTGKLIGSISATHVHEFRGSTEIGFWLGRKHHRQGLMTEAVAKMLEFVFDDLGLKRIDWMVFEGNIASASLAEKFGFTYEGTKRQNTKCLATGKVYSELIYGLLKDDWVARKQ